MPTGVTTNIQLDQLARRMHVPYFRGVFMRNALPISGVRRNESGIVNLDDARNPGTHWVAYAKSRGGSSLQIRGGHLGILPTCRIERVEWSAWFLKLCHL